MIYLADEVGEDGLPVERRIIAADEDEAKLIAEQLGYTYVRMLILEFEDFNLN
jgi:hypothetical protein